MKTTDRISFQQRLYQCLGHVVAARRKKLALSQSDLAEKAHVDRAFISNIERGRRRPSFGLVADLARGLKMRFSRLVENCERCARERSAGGADCQSGEPGVR